MYFCEKCQNMYYLRLSDEDENTLKYYCRKCGYEDNKLTQESICISDENIEKNTDNFDNILNPYVKFDPTLPRIYHISCINNECSSNRKNNPDNKKIMYIRYDENNMKYIYLCGLCDTHWKSDIKNTL